MTKLTLKRHQYDWARAERRSLVFYAGYADKTDIINGWPGVGLLTLQYAHGVGIRIPRSMRIFLKRYP